MPAVRHALPFDASRAAKVTARQPESTLNTSASRQPFSSPNPSLWTLQELDQSSYSEQEDDDQKPSLNVVTSFANPKMPMKAADLTVNQVNAQQTQARRQKAISVISQKGLQLTSTPPDDMPPLKSGFMSRTDLQTSVNEKKAPPAGHGRGLARDATSPEFQRIPIGITIPERDVQAMRENLAPDSALNMYTPVTPSIVITPAEPDSTWSAGITNVNKSGKSPLNTSSSMPHGSNSQKQEIPPVPQLPSYEDVDVDSYEHGPTMGTKGPRTSTESSDRILPKDEETLRHKSQGWWNVMLSPLLRNGSVTSKRSRFQGTTPPVPPLPFTVPKTASSPMSARTDPSFVVSENNDTSPDTPRRIGMATARTSTWSRWTEWEEEREANSGTNRDIDMTGEPNDGKNGWEPPRNSPMYASADKSGSGLAAEYYHACAVEQATGMVYFECLNHSCVGKLPKLQSIHDREQVPLASPFEPSRELPMDSMDEKKPGLSISRSPSIFSDMDHQGLSPNELSPNVRKANTAAVVQAREIQSVRSSPTSEQGFIKAVPDKEVKEKFEQRGPPQYVPQVSMPRSDADLPNIAAVAPLERSVPANSSVPDTFDSKTEKLASYDSTPAIPSPGPLSPDAQKSLAPTGGMQMSHFQTLPSSQPQPYTANNYDNYAAMPERPAFVDHETSYPDVPADRPNANVTINDISPESHFRRSIEERRRRLEKEDAIGRKAGGLWRGRGCIPNKGCFGRADRAGRLRRRWIAAISSLLLGVIIVCIVLAITLTRKGDNTPIQSQWLNLTGFPPLPTGISTIAVPNLQSFQNQCVSPPTMWSCAVPKDSQDELNGNDPTQPNFRFEIRFKNNTDGVPANETIPLDGTGKSSGKTATDPFINDLFTPNPSPPSTAEQIFLGNTTDNITQPFNGETTPFFITFISAWPSLPPSFNASNNKRSLILPRQSNNTSSIGNSIPAPATNADGTAANATLLPTDPYPFSQPLRLYNRGEQTEHYGFYTYYDKSVYLSGFNLNDTTSDDNSNNDQNGGSTLSAATSFCTFSQTRYLVKFFTNSQFGGSLLGTPPPIDGDGEPSSNQNGKNSTTSATDFTRPGSFPYPASIILDRHGGDETKKGVYCYGIDDGEIQNDVKIAVGELTTAGGGTVINPAPALTGSSSTVDKSLGGIDGGTGGCQCTYQNWH